MSEITVEQAINLLIMEKKNSLSSKHKVVSCAYEMAIQALEENEKLKAENKKLETELAEMIFDEDKLNKQMSAVEVLEWFINSTQQTRYDVFAYNDIYSLLMAMKPSEIVDKITEYEKNRTISKMETVEEPQFNVGDKVLYKGENFIIESIDGKDEIGLAYENGITLSNYVKSSDIEHAEPPKQKYEPGVNSDEFKVDEWVTPIYCDLPKKITEIIDDRFVRVIDKDGKTYSWNVNEIKHTEQPKESNIKWIWECESDDEEVAYYSYEENAIKWCEYKAKDDITAWYRKVCVRKE